MIICEIGLNHNGKCEYLYHYINDIVKTKANGISIQIRENLFYKNKSFSHLELQLEAYEKSHELITKSKLQSGIAISNLDMLKKLNHINYDFYKVLSWDINNFDLLSQLIKINKPIFVSTGVATIAKLKKVILYFKQKKRFHLLTLIHTQLSNKLEDVNLTQIDFLKNKFGCKVSFGNHCKDLNAIIASSLFRPSDILFYVKGQKDKKHIDDDHAVNLKDINSTIEKINSFKLMLGKKQIIPSLIKDKFLIQN